MEASQRRNMTVSTWVEMSWRDRLAFSVIFVPKAIARSAIVGLRASTARRVNALLGRMVAKIPDHSPGDAFST